MRERSEESVGYKLARPQHEVNWDKQTALLLRGPLA